MLGKKMIENAQVWKSLKKSHSADDRSVKWRQDRASSPRKFQQKQPVIRRCRHVSGGKKWSSLQWIEIRTLSAYAQNGWCFRRSFLVPMWSSSPAIDSTISSNQRCFTIRHVHWLLFVPGHASSQASLTLANSSQDYIFSAVFEETWSGNIRCDISIENPPTKILLGSGKGSWVISWCPCFCNDQVLRSTLNC